jgi:enamine deaminase RidA (YjgF/YER057c/UK114 family)
VLGDGFAAQASHCCRKVIAILAASGMTAHDLMKVITFVTDTSCAAELGRTCAVLGRCPSCLDVGRHLRADAAGMAA